MKKVLSHSYRYKQATDHDFKEVLMGNFRMDELKKQLISVENKQAEEEKDENFEGF